MPWIAFDRDYLWCPEAFNRHVGLMFKKGNVIFATREAAAKALKGKAAREATEDEIRDARRRA